MGRFIIDEYSGRIMPDRFWNDGLHQMIEAKEKVAPSGLRSSVARITYQRFFARYHHLCGMSGTLAEVTRELRTVYGVGVASIPTHNPNRRERASDGRSRRRPRRNGGHRGPRLDAGRRRARGAGRHPVCCGLRTGERAVQRTVSRTAC